MPQDASALPAALLAQAIQFDIESQISGRTYRIFVQQSLLEAPDDGYPLIVTLDGNLSFPIAATLSRTFVPPLGAGGAARWWSAIDGLPAEIRASMAVDLNAARRLELPWLLGAVVQKGPSSAYRRRQTPSCARRSNWMSWALKAERTKPPLDCTRWVGVNG
jgi:hypothetical protein